MSESLLLIWITRSFKIFVRGDISKRSISNRSTILEEVYAGLEKRIRISTQGRITIPKEIRDRLGIEDGQPVIVRTTESRKEVMIELQPKLTDFK